MTVDVDAVNERLNGLVNLLHVVGIDGVDTDALVEEQKRLTAQNSGTNRNAAQSNQSSDAQILEIIKKLQLAQADSPEILAALKSPELRALASLAAQKQNAQPEPAKKPAPSLDDVMDDDDNYPKIGPGYSDDISVVSDLTTPTVMNRQQVAEEEFYKDINGGPGALPPMHIGMSAAQPSRPSGGIGQGMHGGGGKTRNLVSQVRPAATRRSIAKTGGAAAQRRLNYQQAMAKLQSSDYPAAAAAPSKKEKSYMEHFSPKKQKDALFPPVSPTPTQDPSEFPSIAEQGKKPKHTRNKVAVPSKKGKKTALSAQEISDLEFDDDPQARLATAGGGNSSVGSGPGKKKSRAKSQELDWGTSATSSTADSSGWPAFDDHNGSAKADNFGDNSDFFGSDPFGSPGSSDPFASGAPTGITPAPPSRKPSSRREKTPKEEGQGSGSKPRKPRKEGKEGESKKDRPKKSKSRRAELSM